MDLLRTPHQNFFTDHSLAGQQHAFPWPKQETGSDRQAAGFTVSTERLFGWCSPHLFHQSHSDWQEEVPLLEIRVAPGVGQGRLPNSSSPALFHRLHFSWSRDARSPDTIDLFQKGWGSGPVSRAGPPGAAHYCFSLASSNRSAYASAATLTQSPSHTNSQKYQKPMPMIREIHSTAWSS